MRRSGAVPFRAWPTTADPLDRRPRARAGPSPAGSRPTSRRRSSPPATGSRTSARSASAWRWAARCGASWSSGSPASSASCGSGFTQLAALYVLADGSTLTVGELAEVDQPLTVGDEPAHRRPRRSAGSSSASRGGGSPPADPSPDAARPRGAAGRGPGAGRPVPVRRPAAADGRAGDRGDGRRRPGDPCHQPARPAHPGHARTGT